MSTEQRAAILTLYAATRALLALPCSERMRRALRQIAATIEDELDLPRSREGPRRAT